jgi:hypothetical protein
MDWNESSMPYFRVKMITRLLCLRWRFVIINKNFVLVIRWEDTRVIILKWINERSIERSSNTWETCKGSLSNWTKAKRIKIKRRKRLEKTERKEIKRW